MQIVIDIPEDRLRDIQRIASVQLRERFLSAEQIIANGKPLSKGHGRLIDADKYHEILEDMPVKNGDKWFNWLQKACNRLAEMPTIIEANKGE